MSTNHIIFRGVSVIEGWPEKIQESQSITTCYPNGIEMERVRYGSEKGDWGTKKYLCHDCAAIKGEFHVPGCDVGRCSKCDGQIGGCECDWPEEGDY